MCIDVCMYDYLSVCVYICVVEHLEIFFDFDNTGTGFPDFISKFVASSFYDVHILTYYIFIVFINE